MELHIFKNVFVNFGVVCFAVLLKFGAGHDLPDKPFCMKQVDERIAPKCELTLQYEGSLNNAFNATCIEDNVFLVSHNTSRTHEDYPWDPSNDLRFLEEKFENELVPPFARIQCQHSAPMNFGFDGVGMLEFFTVKRGRWWSNYTLSASFLLKPESTGKIVISSMNDSSAQTSIFIFTERGKSPYLVGRSRAFIPATLNGTVATLPCIASDMIENVTLFKAVEGIWTKVGQSEISSYNRQTGFTLTSASPGDFRCTGTDDSASTDFVNIKLSSNNTDAQQTKISTLMVDIVDGTAVCYSSEGREDLNLVNLMAQNPEESKILELCLQRKGAHCGVHSIHLKKEGVKSDERECPNNATSCVWISRLHRYGLIYCETIDEGTSISQTYFTGLDNRIYTNTSGVPWDVLIKPGIRSRQGPFTLYTDHEILCRSAYYPLVNSPHVLSAKYKSNGSVLLLQEFTYGVTHVRYEYVDLIPDMDELTCSDALWENNERLNSTVKLINLERNCGHDQFACANGNCIWAPWRCYGGDDCWDESDEMDCSTHHCERGGFRCTNNTCIPYSKKCNNERDCDNGADETPEACANTYCGPRQFKCASGQCIYAGYKCSGVRDCFDGSDEANCTAHHCRQGGFQCLTGNYTCIPASKKCNNVKDCPDGSDEIAAICGNNYCNSHQFKCTSGQCLGLSGLCDGIKQCLDETDESNCTRFHPQFLPTETELIFTQNAFNELVCEITNVTKYKPVVSWWRRGLNLSETEPARVWYDGTGLAQALRFSKNMTSTEGGEYICIATNRLHTATQVYTVTVIMPKVTTTTTSTNANPATTAGGPSSSTATGADAEGVERPENKTNAEQNCDCSTTGQILGVCLLVLAGTLDSLG